MNTLTEAIKLQYQRQQELIEAQNINLVVLANNLQGKVKVDIMYHLRDTIYKYYQRELEDINIALIAPEGVRDSEQ